MWEVAPATCEAMWRPTICTDIRHDGTPIFTTVYAPGEDAHVFATIYAACEGVAPIFATIYATSCCPAPLFIEQRFSPQFTQWVQLMQCMGSAP